MTWTSSNSAVATIDANGVATGLKAGTITITANGGTASDTASLTISPATVTAVQVTPATAAVYLEGPPISFVATAQHSDGSSEDVTQSAQWTSSKEYIATVSSNGMATPLSCVGATTIGATYQGMSGSATLQVGSGPELIAIELEPVSLTVPAGMNLTIEATGVYSDSSTKDISQVASWSSSDPSIAVVDTSYSVAVTGVSMGSAQVTASLCGLKSQPAEVTVGAPEIIGLQITGTGTYLTSGCPGRLKAVADYSDGSQGDATDLATWSSSNPNVAEVLNQPAPGLLLAMGMGSTYITAQVQGWLDTTQVVVNSGAYRSAAPLPKAQLGPLGPWRTTMVGIIIEPKAAWSPIHGIVGFRSWTIFSNNDWVELSTAATWSSDQPTIATMDQIGVATALAGGNTTIQASFAGIAGTASLTVVDATLKSMAVTCDPARAQPGVRLRCKALAEWEDGNALDVGRVATWSSSHPDVVAVTGGNLTAVSPGLATITATHAGQTDSVDVEVLDAQLVELQIVPPFATIPMVQRQEYQAVGLYSDGPPQMLTDQVVWTTTLDHNGGRVWGSYPGTSSIHAALGGVSTEAWLEVLPIVQTGVKVIPSDAATFSQHRTEFAAVAQYEGGYRAFVTPRAIWGGSANVANFDPGPGVVTGAAPGSHSVAANFCFATSNAQVAVSDAQLTSITVTPSTTVMHRGTKTQYRAFGSFTDGSSGFDITNQVAWTTTDKNVAMVDDRGTVIARDAGAIEVRATFGRTGVQGATTLTVDGQATLDRIYVWFVGPGHQGSPTNPTTTTAYLPLGGQVQARAVGVFINGSGTESFQDITELVTWSSSTPARAMPSNAVGERGLVTAALDAAQVGSAAMQALYDDGTTVVLSSNQASLTVTACDSYTSFEVCQLDANDVCNQVANVVVGKNLPVSLGAIATFDVTAAGCQGLDQKGYFATGASIWSPADGTVALVANQHRAGEVIAVGPGGAQTQLTAHWTGTSPAAMDTVTVEVGP